MARDPRAEPKYGERVPYVVVYRDPGTPLVPPAPPIPVCASCGPGRFAVCHQSTSMPPMCRVPLVYLGVPCATVGVPWGVLCVFIPECAFGIPCVPAWCTPGARLVDMVVDPLEVLDQAPPGLRLHGAYYVTKQVVPALHRVLALVGADVAQWLAETPRVHRPLPSKRVAPLHSSLHRKGHAQGAPVHQGGATAAWGEGEGLMGAGGEGIGGVHVARGGGGRGRGGRSGGSRGGARGGGTIDQYYASRHCAVCGALTRGSGPGASSVVPAGYPQHTPLCPRAPGALSWCCWCSSPALPSSSETSLTSTP